MSPSLLQALSGLEMEGGAGTSSPGTFSPQVFLGLEPCHEVGQLAIRVY